MKKSFSAPEFLSFFISLQDEGVFNKEKIFEDVDKWISSVSPDIWKDNTIEVEVEIIEGEIEE